MARRRLPGRPHRQGASRPGLSEFRQARDFTQAEQDVFPGCPALKDGYYRANDKPGLGIDLDEKSAAKFPIGDDPPFDMQWGNLRCRDGTAVKPLWNSADSMKNLGTCIGRAYTASRRYARLLRRRLPP